MSLFGVFTSKDLGYAWLFGDFTAQLRSAAYRTAVTAIECGLAFRMPEVSTYCLLGTSGLGVGVEIGIDDADPANVILTLSGGKRVLRALAMAASQNPFTIYVSGIGRREGGDWELQVTMALITDPVALDDLNLRQLEGTGP